MTRRPVAAIGLSRRAPGSRRLPNDRFLAPDCVSARSRTHRAPDPKTPTGLPKKRFRSMVNCASVFRRSGGTIMGNPRYIDLGRIT